MLTIGSGEVKSADLALEYCFQSHSLFSLRGSITFSAFTEQVQLRQHFPLRGLLLSFIHIALKASITGRDCFPDRSRYWAQPLKIA